MSAEAGSGTREGFDRAVTNGVHFLEERDANGKKIDFKTDRTFGKDGALWHFKYMDQGKDHAIKTLTLTVDGVKELPDSYVLFVENWGTSNKYTARLTIDLTKAK